ncbi:MAG TPA: hypothetical protein DCK76_01825 [Desulfotomaculum sp.]|nr:MAG: LmbE family protein [Desulfotomaculum sp. 46_296]HAG10139.1 hypothetical protein [Desulfotomaculum sp.]HBY03670.1 hypothetical protein [Desulfotomaculum sp.]
MRVLVIAPHMDDETLGAGGAITKHVTAGDQVTVCFIANRAYNHVYDNCMIQKQKEAALKSKEILGYNEAIFFDLNDEQLDEKTINILVPLEKLITELRPEIIYLNHRGDTNQDHSSVFKAGIIAARTFANPYLKRILCYEILSSTDQAPPFQEYGFLPNYYVNIEDFIQQKINALKCYEDELRIFPHPRSVDGVVTLAKKRGMEIGYQYAEAFSLVREKWD